MVRIPIIEYLPQHSLAVPPTSPSPLPLPGPFPGTTPC